MTAPTDVPDAAHIRAVDTTDYRFQPGSGDVSREAVAQLGRVHRAEFMLGSTLVNVSPSQQWLLGRIVSKVVPGADLVGYGGLASATVTFRNLAGAFRVGTIEELANLTVSYRDLLVATAAALKAGDPAADVTAIDELLKLQVGGATVRIGDVLGLNTTDPDAGLIGSVSVPRLLSTGAVLAGANSFITIPDSELNLPEAGTLQIALKVVEGPIRVGTGNLASGTTKQVGLDVRLDLDFAGSAVQDVCQLTPAELTALLLLLPNLLGILNCVTSSTINRVIDARITGILELGLTVAGFSGTQHIQCDADRLRVVYAGSPLLARMSATLQATTAVGGRELSLLDVQVPAGNVIAANGSSGSVDFDAIDVGPVHTVFENATTGLPSARVGSSMLGLDGLVSAPAINVRVTRADVPTIGNRAKNIVDERLKGVLGAVDQYVVSRLSTLLGANIGGADITPQWMDCDDDGSVQLVE